MPRLRRILAKIRDRLRSRRVEAELAREIASHLGLLEEEYLRRGMTPEDARRAARQAYGSVEQARQSHRDERSMLWIEQTAQDFRHACRTLARTPGFTLIAIATVALGVGVNATLFTAYNAIALKPLPVADAGRVVRFERFLQSGFIGENQYAFSYPEYEYCRGHQTMFSALIASSWPLKVIASLPEEPGPTGSRLQAQLVSGNYFAGLGINAAVGRIFGPEEDRAPGANPVVVLSDAFWQREFRGDPRVLGRILRLNGTPFTIIGVAPRQFTGTSLVPQVPDLWAPISMQAQLAPGQDWLHKPTDFELQILGRLDSSIALRPAQAQAYSLVQQFSSTYTVRDRTLALRLQNTAFFGNTDDIRFRAMMGGLMALFAMVLFVACANITNMLLARGAARQREIGVRLALGATRGRVIRHLLAESLVLSLAGGLSGLALSMVAGKLIWVALNQVLVRQLGSSFAFSLNLSPDLRVFLYGLVLSLIAGIGFGLSPALQFTRPDLTTSLKDDKTAFGRQITRSRLRSVLIGGQVAVSMLLLTCAGLLIRGLFRSLSASPGFDAHSVYLIRADYGDDPVAAAERLRRLVNWLQTLPEFTRVSLGSGPMMGTWTPPITVNRPSAAGGAERGRTLASYASEKYLDTLGIPLLRGRNFTRQEAASGAHLAVISESTARSFWPGSDPLGKHFQLDMHFDGKLTDFEVIGIAKDVRFFSVTRLDPAHVYLATDPASIYPVLVRLAGEPRSALSLAWTQFRSFDPNLLPSVTFWNVDTMLIGPQRTLARAMAMLAAVLALLALSLAGIGIYGVMGYVVSQRTQEIGIRIALGATSQQVLKSVATQGLVPVIAGMIAGLSCGAGASLLLHSTLSFPSSADFLYGVRFYDPWTFFGISIFLAAVSAVASLVPALRALKINPAEALRYE